MVDLGEQHDDHIWLKVGGESWAIQSISPDGKMFILWRGYEPNLEFTVLDASEIDWEKYCNKAVEMLEGMK